MYKATSFKLAKYWLSRDPFVASYMYRQFTAPSCFRQIDQPTLIRTISRAHFAELELIGNAARRASSWLRGRLDRRCVNLSYVTNWLDAL